MCECDEGVIDHDHAARIARNAGLNLGIACTARDVLLIWAAFYPAWQLSPSWNEPLPETLDEAVQRGNAMARV